MTFLAFARLAAVLYGVAFAFTAPGFIGATYVQVVPMLFVLPGDIAEAEGAGVQFQVAVVSGDDGSVDLGVVLCPDINCVFAGNAGLLFDPVGFACGLAKADRTADTRTRADGGRNADIELFALDLARISDRRNLRSPPTRPTTSSPLRFAPPMVVSLPLANPRRSPA